MLDSLVERLDSLVEQLDNPAAVLGSLVEQLGTPAVVPLGIPVAERLDINPAAVQRSLAEELGTPVEQLDSLAEVDTTWSNWLYAEWLLFCPNVDSEQFF